MKHLTRQAAYERVGRMEQLAGIKRYVLQDGRQRGVHAVDLWNGEGLYMTVLPDRASDISSLTFRGRSLCWLSGVGISGPEFWHKGDFEWDRNFGGGMIPNYVLMTYLGLRDTVAAFILPGLIGTYYVLLMKSFFAGIPRELEEAGSIDGLTHIGIFFKIVLPLSKPIMATMALFYMTGYWSNWFNAFLYLDDKKKWPVAYYLRQIINGSATSNDPGATADAAQIASNIKSCCMVLTAAPLICIYPFIQKYFVQGMMLGGVKE